MSIFGSIMEKIFGAARGGAPAPAAAAAAAPGAPMAVAAAAPAAPMAAAAVGDGAQSGGAPVDVAAVLEKMQAASGETLNWRSSIVDLLKLLGLDSSLSARKALAGELHYTGDTEDSATMNVWLHKEVMQQLEANGGKVPADLKG